MIQQYSSFVQQTMYQQSRSNNQEQKSNDTFQSQFSFLSNSTYTPLTSSRPKYNQGSALNKDKNNRANDKIQKIIIEQPSIKTYYSTLPNDPNLFARKQQTSSNNFRQQTQGKSNQQKVRVYYQSPTQVQKKIEQQFIIEQQQQSRDNQLYGFGSNNSQYDHDHQQRQKDWYLNSQHEIQIIEQRILRMQLAQAQIFRRQKTRKEQQEKQRIIKQKQIQSQNQRRKRHEEAHRRQQIVNQRIHKLMKQELTPQVSLDDYSLDTKQQNKVQNIAIIVDNIDNNTAQITIVQRQQSTVPVISPIEANQQPTSQQRSSKQYNNVSNVEPISSISTQLLQQSSIAIPKQHIIQSAIEQQSIRGKIRSLGLLLLKCKKYYQQAKTTVKQSETYKQIQQTKQNIAKQYIQPVTKLYEQLPSAITNVKYQLNEGYSFNSRIMFVTLASIGIGAMRFRNWNQVQIMRLIKRTLFGFMGTSFIVVPEIYYPYLKCQQDILQQNTNIETSIESTKNNQK